MKQILMAAALMVFTSGAFAQGYPIMGKRHGPQGQRWQHENRHQRDRGHHNWQRAGYVQSHPVYRSILAARIPVQKSRQVEKELYRIRQMEARFAYNRRLDARERAILDRELMRLDARLGRYYQRGYAWR